MQFLSITDQSSLKHNFLIIPLSGDEFNELLGQCEKCIPEISVSAILHRGHPYIVADFSSGSWRTLIPLDRALENNETLGAKLNAGDVLTVILTSNPQVAKAIKEKSNFNFDLNDILAFSLTYTKSMAETYTLYRMNQESQKT
jgi:hypothetical protein